MIECIIGESGRENFKWKYAAGWLSVPSCVHLAGLSNLGVGSLLTFQNFCGPLLNYIQILDNINRLLS